ncbi:MAG: hypothetical protein ACR2JC_10125 [Chloroflexota bacterium]
MIKLLMLIIGLALGSAGMGGYLLSEPGTDAPLSPPADPQSLGGRLQTARIRWQKAQAEGRQAGEMTQKRLRAQFEAFQAGTPEAS